MHRKLIKFADDIDQFRIAKRRTTSEELKKNLVRWGKKSGVEIFFEVM